METIYYWVGLIVTWTFIVSFCISSFIFITAMVRISHRDLVQKSRSYRVALDINLLPRSVYLMLTLKPVVAKGVIETLSKQTAKHNSHTRIFRKIAIGAYLRRKGIQQLPA